MQDLVGQSYKFDSVCIDRSIEQDQGKMMEETNPMSAETESCIHFKGIKRDAVCSINARMTCVDILSTSTTN